jgi:hypothetical protein
LSRSWGEYCRIKVSTFSWKFKWNIFSLFPVITNSPVKFRFHEIQISSRQEIHSLLVFASLVLVNKLQGRSSFCASAVIVKELCM